MQKIFFVYKTQRGTNLMRKLAKFRGFWKVFSTIAIPTAVYFMIKVGSLLWQNMINIIEGSAGAGVAIAIPGVKIPGSPIFIPFWYGMISIAVLAIVHEFAHGIVAAMEGIKIKSTGFGFLAILPLAFVELDQKQMAKISPLKRMRILASGAFANVSLYAVLLVILIFVVSPFVGSLLAFNGITVTTTVQDQPAAIAGIEEGTLIQAVNGQEVNTTQQFIGAMSSVEPGEEVILSSEKEEFIVQTKKDPNNDSKPYLGVFLEQSSDPTEKAQKNYGILLPVILWLHGLFWWVANLNFLIGIMNFLPIWALDGSRVLYDLTGYVIKNKKIHLILLNIVFGFFLTLLLFNIIGPVFF